MLRLGKSRSNDNLEQTGKLDFFQGILLFTLVENEIKREKVNNLNVIADTAAPLNG